MWQHWRCGGQAMEPSTGIDADVLDCGTAGHRRSLVPLALVKFSSLRCLYVMMALTQM